MPTPQKPESPTPMQEVGQGLGDMFSGAGGEALHMLYQMGYPAEVLMQMAGMDTGTKASHAQQEDKWFAPHNSDQQIGQRGAQMGQFLLPPADLGGRLGSLGRTLTQGGLGAGIAKMQGNNPIVGGILGGLGANSTYGGGAKALTPVVPKVQRRDTENLPPLLEKVLNIFNPYQQK
jgi:hypothetical protein